MRTWRTAIRLDKLLLALFCAPPAFSQDPYAVGGFNPTTVRTPSVFQGGGAVVSPGMAPEPGTPRGELQRRWYAPIESRGRRTFVERLPVGTFRPLETVPSAPVEWGYKGYSFRPLGRASALPRESSRSKHGSMPLSSGARTGLNRQLPGAGWYSDYGSGSPPFNFRPDRPPVRQRDKVYDSYDPTQPAFGADYPGGIQDVPSTDYYVPQTVDGPQAGRW